MVVNVLSLYKSVAFFVTVHAISIILATETYGQYRILGSVHDSTGHSVTEASVSIIDRKTESAFVFSSTDSKGNFSFELADSIDEKTLAIRVNAVGYEKFVIPVENRKNAIDCIVRLAVARLPDVTVVANGNGVRIKGDTLSYTASAFAGKNDRVLNDVLKNIPGIEISENNVIKYLGKPINHLYIDGDDMFDAKYQVATTAIPWNIVDRIEVIPDNQHIKMLNGILPAYSPGINVTIKDQNKLNMVNSADLAAGQPNLLRAEVNNLAFKPRLKFVNLLKYNNTGTDITRSLGILDESDFIPSPENQGILSILTPPSGNTPGIEKSRFFNNYSTLFGINDFLKTKKEISWKLNAHFVFEKQNQSLTSLTEYILPFDTVSYSQQQSIHAERMLFRVSVTTSVNTKQRYLTNVFSIDENRVSGSSGINTGFSNIGQVITSNPQRYSNSFTSILLLRNKRFFEISSLVSYEKKPQSLLVTPGVQKEILTNNTDYMSSTQLIEIPVFFTNTYVSYKANSSLFFQSYKAGLTTQNADLNSTIFVDPVTGTIQPPDSVFTNHLSWQKNKVYLESNFIIRSKKMVINLTVPVSHNFIHAINRPETPKNNLSKTIIVPDVRIEYKLGQENLIHAGYRYNTLFSGMNELYQGTIMKDFQTFNSNDLPIQQTYLRTANLGMDLKKPLKLWAANFSYFYSERTSEFIRSTILRDKVITGIAIPLKNTIYWSTLSVNASKNLPEIHSKLSVGYAYQYTRSFELQNNFLFPINTTMHYLSADISIQPLTIVTLNISHKTSWILNGQFEQNRNDTKKQTITQSSNSLDCILFPVKNLTIRLNAEQTSLRRTDRLSAQIVFVDASLRYVLPKQNITLECSAKNISNQENYTNLYSSGNVFSLNNYVLRPRMILIGASVTL